MSRKILCSLVLIVTTALIAGADGITEAKVTPNPGGMGSMVQGDGTFTLQNNFNGINFFAKNTGSGQLNSNSAAANQATLTWTGTLSVVAGNYDCYGTLYTNQGMTFYIIKSNTINTNVK